MLQLVPEGVRDWFLSDDERRTQNQLGEVALEYAYQDLHDATSGFSMQLGKGATGSVYKGGLRGGTQIAVKVIANCGPEAGTFEDEVRMLSRFRHPNLVTLFGWGAHKMDKFIVYELLDGGDVSMRLDKVRHGKAPFPWHQRLRIAMDAASGLSHMTNSSPKAFHRDVKPANILLDQNGTAKMADFGLAGTLKEMGKMHLTVQNISGTPGYACPFYIQSGKVSEQSEVYSFGTVLMEMIVNQPPALAGPTGEICYPLLQAVQPAASGAEERVAAILDPTAAWPKAIADSFSSLALTCVSMSPEARPNFEHVVTVLRQISSSAGNNAAGGGYGAAQEPPASSPIGEVMLRCVSSAVADPAQLNPMERNIGFKVDCTGRWVGQVGKGHQGEFFERLTSKEAFACISRVHFELMLEPSEPSGPLMLKHLSGNPLEVDERPLKTGDIVPVRDQSVLKLAGQNDSEPKLVLIVRCRSQEQVLREGHHGALAARPPQSATQPPRPTAVAGPPPSGGIRGLEAILECTKSAGKNLESIALQDKAVRLRVNDAMDVGRYIQQDLFAKLLEEALRTFVSREHLRVKLHLGSPPENAVGSSPSASCWLEVTNRSANPVALSATPLLTPSDGVWLSKDETKNMAEGGHISFLCRSVHDDRSEDRIFLEFTLKRMPHGF